MAGVERKNCQSGSGSVPFSCSMLRLVSCSVSASVPISHLASELLSSYDVIPAGGRPADPERLILLPRTAAFRSCNPLPAVSHEVLVDVFHYLHLDWAHAALPHPNHSKLSSSPV